MSNITLEEKAKQLRREYARQWRANNPDKVKANRERYWLRKAAEIEAAERAGK